MKNKKQINITQEKMLAVGLATINGFYRKNRNILGRIKLLLRK